MGTGWKGGDMGAVYVSSLLIPSFIRFFFFFQSNRRQSLNGRIRKRFQGFEEKEESGNSGL